MMGMSACNRYSPSWEEDADGTKQESLQSVLGIPDIIGTEIDNAALLRSVTDSYCMVSDENKDQSLCCRRLSTIWPDRGAAICSFLPGRTALPKFI